MLSFLLFSPPSLAYNIIFRVHKIKVERRWKLKWSFYASLHSSTQSHTHTRTFNAISELKIRGKDFPSRVIWETSSSQFQSSQWLYKATRRRIIMCMTSNWENLVKEFKFISLREIFKLKIASLNERIFVIISMCECFAHQQV